MAKFPEIKTGSVALCVWAYGRNPDMPVEELRELAKSDKDIANVAGRAQGSARQILGLAPKVGKKRGKRRAKAKPGPKPKTGATATTRKRASKPATNGLEGFVESVRKLEKDNDQLRKTLERVKDMIETAL
jgi:hypothetical protein